MIAFIKLPLFGSFSYPIKCVKKKNKDKNRYSTYCQRTWDGGKALNMEDQSKSGWKLICVNLPLTILLSLTSFNLFLFLYCSRNVSQPTFFPCYSFCNFKLPWESKMELKPNQTKPKQKNCYSSGRCPRTNFPEQFKMKFFLICLLLSLLLPHTM